MVDAETILARARRLVARRVRPQDREDVVQEALLLVLEQGLTVEEAVSRAQRRWWRHQPPWERSARARVRAEEVPAE